MTIHHDYIGCDISKESLDVHDGSCRRLANEGEAIEAFVAELDPSSFVVFEATGPYTSTDASPQSRPRSSA